MKGKWGIIVFILLVIGVAAAVLAVQRSTENRQHASGFSNVNTGPEITRANNPDGTMGPTTWQGNFSNTLPAAYLGQLNFSVTDPVQGRPTTSPTPTHAQPSTTGDQGSHGIPSMTPGQEGQRPSTTPGQGGNGGPQTVTALNLTIAKVEVHLAHLGVPGTKNENQPSVTPGQGNNQNVDKWETLNIGGVQTVNLVALAKTHSLQSLGLTKLANGRYTEVRLYIKVATATLADGSTVTLDIPGRANTVRVVEPFVIDSSKTTTLTMEFDAQNSVIKAGSQYILNPVVAHMIQENQQ